jgi:hypothetical protein
MNACHHFEYGYQRGIFKLKLNFKFELALSAILQYGYRRGIFKLKLQMYHLTICLSAR